jgi:two-component system CheB/CheR fusion protein
LRKLLEGILPKNTTLEDFAVSHTFPGLGLRNLSINARRLERMAGMPGMILLAIEDHTAAPAARKKPAPRRQRRS